MSFITKRERVFNEYDLFDLPARNEGKLKAYASCTDARAWSHFCSDKSEHLVEIIKRNNETVRPKYIPTDVIVNTLMTAKNSEIARLKRKIEEFEQMLTAYDQLDLTCDQKCDIAIAHAAIKAANKELDDMFLDLDLSGFTEGIDSEGFETGKSRGDEPSRYLEDIKTKGNETGKSAADVKKLRAEEWIFEKEKESTPRKETKGSQAGIYTCDASIATSHDPQVDEMQETIISKDAKLSAMQNTIAVMEHDVCEPYCIYAHIYTALEKIFGTLCQNEKYKQYLELLTAGKDTRSIDIKGKILFQIKVLEKFSTALIAPCSQDFDRVSKNCSCYRAEVVAHVETTFALTSAESEKPNKDNKRAQLVADIMENEEMREILSKERFCPMIEDDQFDDCYGTDNYNINVENLKCLKNLQANYDELLNLYDSLKHERDCLYLRCQKFADLENECDCLKNNLREYNQLWKDKEYYKKRSEDLDILKENYFVLSEETSNIETKLKAEQEINNIKSKAVDELRNENIKLEQKIGDNSLQFEKQRNSLVCKLKECECRVVCQEQQIKSLSLQVDKLLDQDRNKIPSNEDTLQSVELIDEIESQKEQIRNLKHALCCSEEEKQCLQDDFEKELDVINKLKYDVEDWKTKYEKALQSNNSLEEYLSDYNTQINELQNKKLLMKKELEKKTSVIENLNNIICNKSREINNLMEEVDHKKNENVDLTVQVKTIREIFHKKIASLANEKEIAMNSIYTARQESLELLSTLKYHDTETSKEMPISLDQDISDASTNEKALDEGNLLHELSLLNLTNRDSINILRNENVELKKSFDMAKKESEMQKQKLIDQERFLQEFEELKQSHENLLRDKINAERSLYCKQDELENLSHDFQITKKNSERLLSQSKDIKEEYARLNSKHQKLLIESEMLQKKIYCKNTDIENCIQSINSLKLENSSLQSQVQEIQVLKNSLTVLQNQYDQLLSEKSTSQKDFDEKNREIKNLYNNLESKIEENQHLSNLIETLQLKEISANSNISALKNENNCLQLNLSAVKKESAKLIDKTKYYENVENEYNELKLDNESLLKDFNKQVTNLRKLQQENDELKEENENLLLYNRNLENTVIHCRDENLSKTDSIKDLYVEVKKEIENLKDEKLTNQKKIRSLMEKLDESEFVITSLHEDISARDKRICTLENYINELEVEIRSLQSNLIEVVESGEELKNLSYEKLDQSLTKMEAHQSKATHNMKIGLAKLQNEKENLEDQLSSTKLATVESLRERNAYMLEIKELKRERETIISDIKQLELKNIGDSNLSTTNCTLNHVLNSLDRIGKYLDSNNSSLKETLLDVQASYQLLKSKADEAKNIAEKERLKIINEKERSKKEKIDIEKRLDNVKTKLEENKINYEKVIKDLEGETLNQKLIFDKINRAKEDNITKLTLENKFLKDQVDGAFTDIKELNERLQNVSKQNSKNLDLIDKTKTILDEKNKTVLTLQKQFDCFYNKPMRQIGVQTISLVNNKNNICQTDINEHINFAGKTLNNYMSENINKNFAKCSDSNVTNNKSSQKGFESLDTHVAPSINEVQILTANVEPTIDFVKNTYLKYKIKKLSLRKLEQYSIASLVDKKKLKDDNDILMLSNEMLKDTQIPDSSLSKNSNHQLNYRNDRIIDIYDIRPSTNSTKTTGDMYSESKEFKISITNLRNNENFQDSNINYDHNKNNLNNFLKSKENDLFVIYKDSNSIYDDQSMSDSIKDVKIKATNSTKKNRDSMSKARPKRNNQLNKQDQIYVIENSSKDKDDDNIKASLKINLPRVIDDISSSVAISGREKSLSSYTHVVYGSPKLSTHSETDIISNDHLHSTTPLISTPTVSKNKLREIFPGRIFLENYFDKRLPYNIQSNQTKNIKDLGEKKLVFPRDSSHELSRMCANVHVLENKKSDYTEPPSEDFNIKSNYGLQYILNTFQHEINPQKNKNLNTTRSLRKSRSDNGLDYLRDSIPSKSFSALKLSSIENRITSTYSPIPTKSVSDRGTLVKMDVAEDYENKIQLLTKALENVEKNYKKKLEAVKLQYDYNVKSIINEHNFGVHSIQNLHEETMHDIIKIHENEVENLRTMSIEAIGKAERLEIQNRCLKAKLNGDTNNTLDEEPTKIPSPERKQRKCRCRINNRMLTKTNVEAFNVKPKRRSYGPCSCSLDVNISDTIRNIFEQVDVEQRKIAEEIYLKHIVKQILDGNVETLDAQELSFLHLKVCRTWKTKLNKEEVLQKKIESLESELMSKRRQSQKHMADLDHKVAEEWHRLQEVREAVCRGSPNESRDGSPTSPVIETAKDICNCNIGVKDRRSAGDLVYGLSGAMASGWKRKRAKHDSKRVAKLDVCDRRREDVLVSDETPTRLKRVHDRHCVKTMKK